MNAVKTIIVIIIALLVYSVIATAISRPGATRL